MQNTQIVLEVPIEEKHKCKYPSIHGEHYGFDGAKGEIIASTKNGAAWVRFLGDTSRYVGCPVAWLKTVN